MSTTHFGHLTERQTEPGLVPFYDIQSGNGVGLFLQPRSPHVLTFLSDIIGVSSDSRLAALMLCTLSSDVK